MAYVCPMHPEIRQDTPGVCPICGGMKLVPEEQVPSVPKKGFFGAYQPLFVIVGVIALATAALAVRDASATGINSREVMINFMAGFFLVFSALKLLDVPGFAKGYATYDLLAQRFRIYGYVYPFLELALGLAYLTRFELETTNVVTFVLMLFSGLGVAISLMRHKKFECACLGTMIKVPLTKVTLIEDFGMAAMAATMLLV